MMLRVVLTVDCDRCKESYFQAAVSTDPEVCMWEAMALELQSCAGSHGWKTAEELGREIICAECLDFENS